MHIYLCVYEFYRLNSVNQNMYNPSVTLLRDGLKLTT